jgi:Cu(I)/Ag(I) efflux system periplasmic protein CusF
MKHRTWLKTAIAIGLSVGLASATVAQQSSVDGTVEKIDKSAGKVTLKHGPIKNLDMDGMTMVFRVQDPSALDRLKVGQKVKFEADRVNGQITATKIQPAK